MVEQYHGPSDSVISGTGGKKRKAHDRKLYLMGGTFQATKVSEDEEDRPAHPQKEFGSARLFHVLMTAPPAASPRRLPLGRGFQRFRLSLERRSR